MKKAEMKPVEYGQTEIGFNIKGVLDLCARQYPSIMAMFLEILQNIIDAHGSVATINVNLKKGTYRTWDNGDGYSRSGFGRFISEVGKTQKRTAKVGRVNVRPLGQFGLGITAPFGGKCEEYVIETCPRQEKGKPNSEGYTRYNFTEIISNPDQNVIPFESIPAYDHDIPSWTTCIIIRGLSFKQEFRSSDLTFTDFVNEASARFGATIAKIKIKILVEWTDESGQEYKGEVTPVEFRGRQVTNEVFSTKDCGKIKFTVHFCEKPTSYDPGIMVETGESDYRLPWAKIGSQARGYISDEPITILRSKHFQGLVLGEKLRIHPNRKEIIVDDAFVTFLGELEKWANSAGKAFLENYAASRKDEFRERIGRQVLKIIDQIRVASGDDSPIVQLLQQFRGGVSDGHVAMDGPKVPAVGSQTRKPRSQSKKPAEPVSPPQNEQVGKTHISLTGPTSKRPPRTLSGKQSGLTIEFNELIGNKKVRWEVDERGVLIINTANEDYSECENSTSPKLREYVLHVIFNAMAVMGIPEENRHIARLLEPALMSLEMPYIIGRTQLTRTALDDFPDIEK